MRDIFGVNAKSKLRYSRFEGVCLGVLKKKTALSYKWKAQFLVYRTEGSNVKSLTYVLKFHF